MKSNRFIKAFIMLIVAFSCFMHEAEAQRARKARVVRRHVHHGHRVRRKVVVRKAHVRYARLPRWGSVVAVVPSAAILVSTSQHTYHFHDGIFYAPRSNDFVVVRPVVGVRVKLLPSGYRTVLVSKRNYYYYYGTFYSKANDGNYEVVDAPEGAIVDALPEGYEVKTIGDTEYYVLDGVYYAEVETVEVEDGVGYEVVKV
jgi:hypothetical protein